jgi:hypothetical protein
MRRYRDNYANPVADQWYRSLDVHKRLFLKETFVDVCGLSWETAGVCLNMRERIAIYHTKLVAEGVIRSRGHGAQLPNPTGIIDALASAALPCWAVLTEREDHG